MTAQPSSSSPVSQSASPANGSAWAALLSAGIGCTAFGIFTMLSECIPAMSKALNWYKPSGALSGVAICAVVSWLVAWTILHARWKGRSVSNERTLLVATILLVLAGIVTTFPPFYELFGG